MTQKITSQYLQWSKAKNSSAQSLISEFESLTLHVWMFFIDAVCKNIGFITSDRFFVQHFVFYCSMLNKKSKVSYHRCFNHVSLWNLRRTKVYKSWAKHLRADKQKHQRGRVHDASKLAQMGMTACPKCASHLQFSLAIWIVSRLYPQTLLVQLCRHRSC